MLKIQNLGNLRAGQSVVQTCTEGPTRMAAAETLERALTTYTASLNAVRQPQSVDRQAFDAMVAQKATVDPSTFDADVAKNETARVLEIYKRNPSLFWAEIEAKAAERAQFYQALPRLAGLKSWLRKRLAVAPEQAQLKALLSDVEHSDKGRAMWIVEEASRNATHVQNLFKILRVVANHDKHIDSITFGINDRQKNARELLSAEKWSGGLPLLVPVAWVLEHMPDYFQVDESGATFYSDAWPRLEQQLGELLRSLVGETVAESFPWGGLKADVHASHMGYLDAWRSIERRDGDVSTLLAFEEVLPMEDDLLLPVEDEELSVLLAIAEEATAVMKATIAGEWQPAPHAAAADAAGIPLRRTSRADQASYFGLPRGVTVNVAPVKGEKRAREKADDKYSHLGAQRYRRVRDLCRMACVCGSATEACATVRWFEDKFRIAMLENRFKKPTSLGWRDLTILVYVTLPRGGEFLAEVQVQLAPLADVRKHEHEKYNRVRSSLGGELQPRADEIIHQIIKSLDKLQAPPKLQQPVPRSSGVLKLYFREYTGFSLTIGNDIEFVSAPPLPASAFGELHTTARDYLDRCLTQSDLQAKAAPKSAFEQRLLETLRTRLFDASGAVEPSSAARFLEEAGSPPRCTSHRAPLELKDSMPVYLKTSFPLSTPERLACFAEARSLDDLKQRVLEQKLTAGAAAVRAAAATVAATEVEGTAAVAMADMSKAAVARVAAVKAADAKAERLKRYFPDMEWSKCPVDDKGGERVVVFLLQGVRDPTLHHIWSCADKGRKDDAGRFFKEPNVDGLTWSAGQLANDPMEAFGLVAILVAMGGA